MAQLEELFDVEPNSWLDALPTYQKKIINALYEKHNNYEDVAQAWLSASLTSTAPFGTEKKKNILFEKFLDEIEAFFSGDEKYEQERLSILGEKGAVQTYVISSISIALAPYFQTSSVFLAPVVSITLFSITKMGINAWLSMRKEQKNKLDSVSKD